MLRHGFSKLIRLTHLFEVKINFPHKKAGYNFFKNGFIKSIPPWSTKHLN